MASRRFWWLLVGMVLVRVGINAANRVVYPFLPVLQQGLGVSFQAMTQALSWRALAPLVALPLAWNIERRGPRFGLALGLGFLVAGYGVLGVWPTWATFVFGILAVLVGKIVADSALQEWIGRQVPYERRGRPLAFIELGWSLSFLAMPLFAWMFDRFPWHWAFLVLALYMGATGGVLWWHLRSPARARADPAGPRRSLWASLGRLAVSAPQRRAFWANHGSALLRGLAPALWMAFAMLVANEMVGVVFGEWLYRAYGVPLAGLGLAAVVIGGAELVGEVVTMLTVDRLGKKTTVALGLAFNTLSALALPVLGKWGLAGALLGLGLFFLTFEFTLVSSIPLISSVWPEHRPLAMAGYAVALIWGRSAAAALTPWVYLSDWGIIGSVVVAGGWNLLALLGLILLREGE